MTCAQIKNVRLATAAQIVQGANVSVRQVDDVNVIAYASAVGCRVVRAKDRNVISLAEWDLKYQRNQMRFGVMVFANGAVLTCT